MKSQYAIVLFNGITFILSLYHRNRVHLSLLLLLNFTATNPHVPCRSNVITSNYLYYSWYQKIVKRFSPILLGLNLLISLRINNSWILVEFTLWNAIVHIGRNTNMLRMCSRNSNLTRPVWTGRYNYISNRSSGLNIVVGCWIRNVARTTRARARKYESECACTLTISFATKAHTCICLKHYGV